SAPPVFKEATNRRLTFIHAPPERRHIPDRVGTPEAQHRVKVTATPSLNLPAHKLGQVRGRGLLGHRLLLEAEVGERAVAVPVGSEISPTQSRWRAQRGRP